MRMHLRRVPSIKRCQAAVLSLCLEKAFLYHAKKVPMTSSSLHSSQTTVTRWRTTCKYSTHQIGFVNHWTFAPVRINILKSRHFLSDFIYSLKISVYLGRRNVKICIHNFPKKLLAPPHYTSPSDPSDEKTGLRLREALFFSPVMNVFTYYWMVAW